MATLSTTLRNEILQQALVHSQSNYLDTEPAYTEWEIRLKDSAGTVLARFPISGWTIANGVATVNGTPIEVTAEASGTATSASLYGRESATAIFDLMIDNMTVGTTAGNEIQMADTSITSGQPVQLTSFSITAPADVVAG